MKKQYKFTFRAEKNDFNFNILNQLLNNFKEKYSNLNDIIFTQIMSVASFRYYFLITFHDDLNIKNFIIKNAEINGFTLNEVEFSGLTYGYTEFNEYTVDEELMAEYSELVELTSDINSKSCLNESGEYLDEIYGTKFTYNENSCEKCSFGRIQNSNLYIDYHDIMGFNIFRFGTHLLLEEGLKNKFASQNFTGIEYRLVKDYRNRNFDTTYYQIVITNTLPKMSDLARILPLDKNRSCQFCNNRVNLLRTNIIYDRINLNHAFDFNKTAEIFGQNRENPLIISKKVRDFINTLNERKDIICNPIEIIE